MELMRAPKKNDFTKSILCQTAKFLKYSSDALCPVFSEKKFLFILSSPYKCHPNQLEGLHFLMPLYVSPS